MNHKRPTLDEVLKNSSAATKRLNISSGGALSRVNVRFAKAARALAAAPPHSQPEPLHGGPLGNCAETEAGGPGGPAVRPRVSFTLYRVALLDGDNKFASVKFLLDALRYAKLLVDDRELDIELVVTQQKVGTYLAEGTGITIDYPGRNNE